LWEEAGLPAQPLPESLCTLYGGPFGLREQVLYANFVETLDGIVALPEVEKSNALVADGSEADKFAMGLLRASGDVVLVGSGTLAPPGPAGGGADDPGLAARRRARRRALPHHLAGRGRAPRRRFDPRSRRGRCTASADASGRQPRLGPPERESPVPALPALTCS